MPAVPEPPELAALVDFAERPRVEGWSIRSALCRYAQPEPARVAQVVELVRRIEYALQGQSKLLASDGPALWAAVIGDAPAPDDADGLVGLLQATTELDRLGDVLATWAVDRTGPDPAPVVDEVVLDVAQRLDALGVPREEPGEGPPRRRGGGR